jgi:pyruvate kinase
MPLSVVMTLGPASEPEPVLRRLALTANAFRLNAAHMTLQGLETWLARLAALRRELPELSVVVDLQGAKMRLGAMPALAQLPPELTLRLASESSGLPVLPVPHPELFAAVAPGEQLTLNDGRIWLEVLRVEEHQLTARVVRNGALSGFKGINRPAHPIACRALTPDDAQRVQVGSRYPFVGFAFSFVHTGQEGELLAAATDCRRVAKLECPESLTHLPAIAAAFDELWLARGDLGEQAGLARLGPLQTQFEGAFGSLGKPVLLGGQVLEHMSSFPQPTRSEVVHLHDLDRRGWTGIVLSDETAIGKHPVEVADFLDGMGHGRSRTLLP